MKKEQKNIKSFLHLNEKILLYIIYNGDDVFY